MASTDPTAPPPELAEAIEKLGEAIATGRCVGCGCPITEPFGRSEIPVCRACFLLGGGDD